RRRRATARLRRRPASARWRSSRRRRGSGSVARGRRGGTRRSRILCRFRVAMPNDAREIRTTEYSYVFGRYAEPIATVRPGEVLDIFTEDAFESSVQSEQDLPTKVLNFPFLNPQTGPIYVEGAEKGDTLVVEIVEIEPTRDFVASAFIPYFG